MGTKVLKSSLKVYDTVRKIGVGMRHATVRVPFLSSVCLIHFLPLDSFSKSPISFQQLVVLSPNDIQHITKYD